MPYAQIIVISEEVLRAMEDARRKLKAERQPVRWPQTLSELEGGPTFLPSEAEEAHASPLSIVPSSAGPDHK
jgi:hypothetical protein